MKHIFIHSDIADKTIWKLKIHCKISAEVVHTIIAIYIFIIIIQLSF